jgi:DNA ligase-1
MKPVSNKFTNNWLQNFPNLDGELILGAPNDEGAYGKTFSAVMSHKGEPELTFWVFDWLADANFVIRHAALLAQSALWPVNIKLVQQKLIYSEEELDCFYEQALANGYEGLMLRSPDSPYKQGKSTAKEQYLLKMKPEDQREAEILDIYEAEENLNEAFENEVGRTSRSTHQENKVGKGMLGGFNCRDTKTGVEFKCAPGKLSHNERIRLWKHGCSYTHLKYLCMGYGTMTNGRPRHPRWVAWTSKEHL